MVSRRNEKLWMNYEYAFFVQISLTLLWWRPLSYRNKSIDLLRKLMDWFLYDIGLRHERVKDEILAKALTFWLFDFLTNYIVRTCFYTAQKMKFSIKDFFFKCDQIRRKLRIWSHLLKKSAMENLIFCAVLWALIKKLK